MDTDRIAGNNKDINPQPIIVKVYSRNVVDLTLVDLPGMTKIPCGDQPSDIEKKILDLCYQYTVPKTAIIMAVTPANQDLANSDALKLARKVDPYGERTIGVLTKIDLMDEGTSALDIIQGKVYPLKLGYIGVVCRSQKDIMAYKPIKEAIAAEENFFRTSPTYAPFASKLGTGYLCRNLNIKRCLPIIRSKITSMLYQKEKELKSLQLSGDDGQLTEQQLVLNIIAKYSASYSEFLEGRFVKDTAVELKGGSRLNYIYYEVYTAAISGIDPFDALTDDDIKTAIRNASSLRPNLFVPEVAFEVLSKQQINRLESPSLQCVQLVYEELRRVVNEIEMPELQRF
jgi:dynamin 1-like protein